MSTPLFPVIMRRLSGAVVLILMVGSTVGAQQVIPRDDRVSENIYRELITLPYYGVFDHMKFEVGKAGVVTLRGAVRNPRLKQDAEARAKSVEGVEEVRNEIEVLPAAPQDDRIRLQTYRAIYRHDVLERYGLNAVPPIHIIVKQGNITLEGMVDSKLDSQVAEMQARGVPGTFTITNNLEVDGK